MIYHAIISVCLVLSFHFASSQNIVPNFSFEDTITCPGGWGGISEAIEWFQPCTCTSSSDYFNPCDSGGFVDVPNNSFGFQYPQESTAYAGIIMYDLMGINYREFIEIKLSDTLIQSFKYCISFYISLANESKYAINTIGCLFTSDSFLTNTLNEEIFLIPQIENTDSIITDTMNWFLISGEFTASGGEKFITIGNFRNDNNTSIMQVQSNGFSFAYYYIDDVSVTLCDSDTVGINELQEVKSFSVGSVYPNPNDGNMQLDYQLESGQNGLLIIYDIVGQKVKNYSLKNDRNTLKISDAALKNGIYFYEILINDEIINSDKLIIIR